MSKEIAEEYASSLGDLTVNSKPLINMLTILAEENLDHAGVIVETVEKHLEKVPADIKLPVLYLVDSIIKNVGGAYTQKFAQIIVNMFTRTFKQVDERVRSQMFKLRETWHDVFPATKLYQLDVKVNLIDPAWPIQAQPQQANIHVNPNFLKKPLVPTSSNTPSVEEEEKMRSILAKKEQELLMLQRKKLEMELKQTRQQLEQAEKNAKKKLPAPTLQGPPPTLQVPPPTMPVALMTPVAAPLTLPPVSITLPDTNSVPVKQRLGPPVYKPASGARITPVSGALATARRDPRLVRRQQQSAPPPPQIPPVSCIPPIAPNVFDIKPLERNVTKRKNVITIDVKQDVSPEPRSRDPRRHDPRLEKRDDRQRRDRNRARDDRNRKSEEEKKRFDIKKNDIEKKNNLEKKNDLEKKNGLEKKSDLEKKTDEKTTINKVNDNKNDNKSVNEIMDKLQIADPKKINKLPPIPKIVRDEVKEKLIPSPTKRRKDLFRNEKKKRRDNSASSKDSSGSSSPEKKVKDLKEKTDSKELNHKANSKDEKMDIGDENAEAEVVTFKELKNYHKERYMRRNKEKSESPEKIVEVKKVEEVKPIMEVESSNVPEAIVENKDVDLRVLSAVVPPIVAEIQAAPVAQKRSSTDTTESKPKKNKLDKFDILFGSEDVDLRQLPQVEEIVPPPPPVISEPSKIDVVPSSLEEPAKIISSPVHAVVSSPLGSPKKDWNEVMEKEVKKTPSKLDLVRAKLAEATKGKDRLGRPLLFNKSPSIERERRRTLSSEDSDLRTETQEEFDADDHKKTISIIMSQAKEQFNDGQLDKNQYNTLMFQVMQLNEKLKLKEAKQRESLEISKRKLKAHIDEETHKPLSPKTNGEQNKFGDIDERIPPPMFLDTPPDNQGFLQDSDMRVAMIPNDIVDGPKSMKGLLPLPSLMPLMMPPFPPPWRGSSRPRMEEFVPRRMIGPPPPFLREKFDKRGLRGPIDPMILPLPVPKLGTCQRESPLQPYERTSTPPPLGAPGVNIPPTDFRLLEYIDQDPMKTIQIDGIQREIRFYGDTAVVMLDWDDPRQISFLPGSRRITFDNKDSIVLSFNEGYRQVEIDDQVFDIKFGAPTRELYINGRWYECLFGGQPMGVIIDGKPRLIHVEGPLPQVDIGKDKRLDLVAGKINLIVDAKHMCPIFLDAKVQKFRINTDFFTIRFVDALRTVMINEQPFEVEFGGLPRPIFVGNQKHFIRFSVLPRHVKRGHMKIVNMDGSGIPAVVTPSPVVKDDKPTNGEMEVDPEPLPAAKRTPSPEGVSQGLDMLASVMPTDMAPSSGSEYVSVEPLFVNPDKIPGLETPSEEKPPNTNPSLPLLENINVNDLFAKLVATGIVQLPTEPKKEEPKEETKAEDPKSKPNEDKSAIHRVDWLRPETLRVKQPGLVAKLYGGMQCSGCGTRFPPEQTVRYSQHLDWHFRQNRRERDSARRAHSRHWHYDLCDWVQYEEVEDLEEREKNWFETGGAEGETEGPKEVQEETPSVPAGAPVDQFCAMCGDKFDQFYNEDKEEWHLRKAVRHEDKNYHPLCFEDFKTSQAKEEPVNESMEEVIAVDKLDEVLEIKDIDDIDESDNESVVEVVEPEEVKDAPLEEPVEIDEGEEDDVVLKADPVEQVVVEDEVDTDDETRTEREERDQLAMIDFSKVKVKQEPIDPDDEPIITAEEEVTRTNADTTHTTVLSSIDGNVQLDSATTTATSIPLGGIRINISKSIPTLFTINNIDDKLEDISADDEPLPPGEEPELEYKLKPNLEGIQFSRQPPLRKGNELSGLCSIM